MLTSWLSLLRLEVLLVGPLGGEDMRVKEGGDAQVEGGGGSSGAADGSGASLK